MDMNITKDIRYVGVNDHELDLFEGQYAVPNGMVYNSYVILDEKTAVIDTVDRRFTRQWLDNVVTDLARDDMAEAVEDAFRYGKLVLATTTYNADIFPFMRTFVDHLKERGYQNRTVALMENGSWAPQAAKVIKTMLEGCKDLTFAAHTVSILSALNDESRQQIEALSDELCRHGADYFEPIP